MLLFVSKSHDQLPRRERVGSLVTPLNGAIPGDVYGADNGAYTGFDPDRYRAMLERLRSYPGCRFVAVPDVVGDAAATDALWWEWSGEVAKHLPAAYVSQDGATVIPRYASALFIGGTTEWKLSDASRSLVQEAHRRHLWIHMGRVNSHQRLRTAQSWGCHSIDGSSLTWWTDTYLDAFLDATTYQQLPLV